MLVGGVTQGPGAGGRQVRIWMPTGTEGFWKNTLNCPSSLGWLASNRFFWARPMAVMATSGLPIRETCRKGPDSRNGCAKVGLGISTRVDGRLAVVQPATTPPAPAPRQAMGTSSARVVMFLPARLEGAAAGDPTGLRLTRSKNSPRFIAN